MNAEEKIDSYDSYLVNLIGSSVAAIEFEDGKLPDDHQFSWESNQKNPKGDLGEIRTRRGWYKEVRFHNYFFNLLSSFPFRCVTNYFIPEGSSVFVLNGGECIGMRRTRRATLRPTGRSIFQWN
jgi:hypothetical protein